MMEREEGENCVSMIAIVIVIVMVIVRWKKAGVPWEESRGAMGRETYPA